VSTPTFSVEVIPVPVRNVDRALRFYIDRVGFTLDVDYAPIDAFRVVQLTPPGSCCSVQIGRGVTDAPVGSLRNVYLVVTDLEAARSFLVDRGRCRCDPAQDARRRLGRRLRTGARPRARGLRKLRRVADPDGNRWVLQERGYRKDVP
jgi:catechol 2,3-dioxygenase-like lactoylglutathione lyase family enzyme